jgi:hypothetical protein
MSVKSISEDRQSAPRVVNDDPRHFGAGRRRLLRYDDEGTAFDRLASERSAVGMETLERNEHVTAFGPSRVVRNRRDDSVGGLGT